MKPAVDLYPQLHSFRHLYQSAHRAARGKKSLVYVDRFLLDLESNLLALEHELQSQSYCPGPYHQFVIHDPKQRTISAAPFRDRVVHHAVCLLLEPIFEKHFIYHSYACRRGKGVHRALAVARGHSQRYRYFLKMDVAHFYQSIDHDLLKGRLRRLIKDRDFLWLLDTIIDIAPCEELGKGIPIGNLTSQYFANFLLSRLDHYCKNKLRLRPYLRYMDDVLIFAEEKSDLVHCRAKLEQFLPPELRLEWKHPATILAPVGEGVPFLGFKIYPTHTRVLPKNWRRFKKHFLRRQQLYLQGEITMAQLQMSVESMIDYLRQGNTYRLRRDFLARCGLEL